MVAYISHCKQRSVEEHQHTERQEQAASCTEGDANLWFELALCVRRGHITATDFAYLRATS